MRTEDRGTFTVDARISRTKPQWVIKTHRTDPLRREKMRRTNPKSFCAGYAGRPVAIENGPNEPTAGRENAPNEPKVNLCGMCGHAGRGRKRRERTQILRLLSAD
jgi:hypothetical protein